MKFLFLCLLFLLMPRLLIAAEVKIAVASNFLSTFRIIKHSFEKTTGHKILLSAASTGKLYAQINHGAPFEIFMAADIARPEMVEKKGLAIPGSRFVYATGRLSLWSAMPSMQGEKCLQALRNGQFNRLAIANPKTAPYGKAAQQTLKEMGLWKKYKKKMVRGENIAQTFQYASTGNAELGLIALSQVIDPKNTITTCRWNVPTEYHQPLEQQLVVLKKGEKNPAAAAFVEFIKSEEIRKIIAENGYGVD